MKILVFDIWGDYAHYKKIYATTSAVTYLIPTKPAIYGYIGAMIGLEKFGNHYLSHFQDKSCLVGLSLMGSATRSAAELSGNTLMRRLGVNLRAQLGPRKSSDPPKPTLMEFVYRPRYRLYVHLSDHALYQRLKSALEEHKSVYTLSLGIAGLLSNFSFIGEFTTEKNHVEAPIPVHSVIPKKYFQGFDSRMFSGEETEYYIVEQSMFALEMDIERNVVERDDILLERTGKAILAKVSEFYTINGQNIILF